MIDDPVRKPRNVFGIIAIAVFLGGLCLMLWMGRWKAALAYLLIVSVALAFFLFNPETVRNSVSVLGLDQSEWGYEIPGLLFASIWLVYALFIRKQALARPWYSRWYVALLGATLVPTLLAAFLVRIFFFQPFNIPAASNIPNLMVGDYVFVSKSAYGYSRYSFPLDLLHFDGRTSGQLPQRGDMAIFKLPSDTRIDYVKRVVGLPGDRIQMIGGVLHINGVAVKLEPVQLPDMFYVEGKPNYFRETLPEGRSYVIANGVDDGNADDTDEYNVPAGHYFVMGDSRDNSQDSRYLDAVGYIPAENFIGPVVFRFWNSSGLPLDNRPEEIFVQP